MLGDEATIDGNPLTPKVFTHFGGPYNCSTGEEIQAERLRQITLAYLKSADRGVGKHPIRRLLDWSISAHTICRCLWSTGLC